MLSMKESDTAQGKGAAPGDELALLVDAVQDYAIFLLSPEGVIRSWNRGAARILGYDTEEIVGESFHRFYSDEDLASRKPHRELEIAEAAGRVEDEGWRLRKDGGRFWANTVITALRDGSGTLTGFAKVTRDLTERRNSEERQRQSEELNRLLIESVREYAIFLLDPAGKVVSWNSGAQRIKGYAADEIIGRHFSTFYTPEDVESGKPERKLETARREGWVEDEGWRVRKDGTRFWANVVITAIHDETGELRGFAKVTRDITDRREAERTRLEMYEQREALLLAEDQQRRAEASAEAAREANRAKDEFLMMLSHELRTPMTSILGWAKLLPDLEPRDPAFAEAIAAIGRSASIQARLIDDMLDVSRIVAGKIHFAREYIDVKQLVQDAVDAVRKRAEEHSLELRTDVADDAGGVTGDPTRLHQIMSNLMANALKFTPDGGAIRIVARRTGPDVTIQVIDTGEGIEEELLERIFEPFRQSENPRTRVHGGLGLGLAIARKLVEAHGGSVRAESEGRGRGATFTVVLPVELTHSTGLDAGQTDEHPEVKAPRKPLQSLDVLLVEDEPDSRSYVSATLRMAGANVVGCDSAQSALLAFGSRQPDVVITDIAMPEVDGYQLARMLRAQTQGPRLVIVALSAFPASPEQADLFDRYLNKPIEPHQLVDSIARLMSPTSDH